MSSIEVITARFDLFNKMYSGDLREQSFANWPFREDCKCTPEKLEGWEPDDDPWHEHINRSPTCEFLHLKKDVTELTVAEFFHIERERLKIFVRKVCHKKMAHLRDTIDETLKRFRSQLDSV
ncbi:baculoviral IAP repeat-containing protein 5b isoform X2 [Phyllopteryx taeniolatus]|uniref:baculoviral IAP repeat-containing protein 5b isoform X2 n=1 Tax=Phyllopteryx taeniolatus TaxID=161469 RepID=UPI002AD5516B|nr:baculoviral IAP repeat-containing protein 5b isoform X2 [Phyllopteryx taeniolatus]